MLLVDIYDTIYYKIYTFLRYNNTSWHIDVITTVLLSSIFTTGIWTSALLFKRSQLAFWNIGIPVNDILSLTFGVIESNSAWLNIFPDINDISALRRVNKKCTDVIKSFWISSYDKILFSSSSILILSFLFPSGAIKYIYIIQPGVVISLFFNNLI